MPTCLRKTDISNVNAVTNVATKPAERRKTELYWLGRIPSTCFQREYHIFKAHSEEAKELEILLENIWWKKHRNKVNRPVFVGSFRWFVQTESPRQYVIGSHVLGISTRYRRVICEVEMYLWRMPIECNEKPSQMSPRKWLTFTKMAP